MNIPLLPASEHRRRTFPPQNHINNSMLFKAKFLQPSKCITQTVHETSFCPTPQLLEIMVLQISWRHGDVTQERGSQKGTARCVINSYMYGQFVQCVGCNVSLLFLPLVWKRLNPTLSVVNIINFSTKMYFQCFFFAEERCNAWYTLMLSILLICISWCRHLIALY